jgi:hypothetical protein
MFRSMISRAHGSIMTSSTSTTTLFNLAFWTWQAKHDPLEKFDYDQTPNRIVC